MTQIAPAPPNPTSHFTGLAPPPAASPPAALWSEARIAALKRAWRQGLSARQIAAQLGGGLSRSAVIGKLHRLGLCGGRKPSAPRAAVSAPSAPSLRARPDPASCKIVWLTPFPEVAPMTAAVSAGSGSPPSAPGAKYLRDMGPRECRYGLGDPGVGAGYLQLFCAAPTQGHAYCAHHRALAILPPPSLTEQKVINADLERLVRQVKRSAERRSAGVAR